MKYRIVKSTKKSLTPRYYIEVEKFYPQMFGRTEVVWTRLTELDPIAGRIDAWFGSKKLAEEYLHNYIKDDVVVGEYEF